MQASDPFEDRQQPRHYSGQWPKTELSFIKFLTAIQTSLRSHHRSPIPDVSCNIGPSRFTSLSTVYQREFSSEHGVNPMAAELEAVTFGTTLKLVTWGTFSTHGSHEPVDGAGYYDFGAESLINIGRIRHNELEEISEHVTKA